jgi:predicted phosphate transport protein (TIGR00153 family)
VTAVGFNFLPKSFLPKEYNFFDLFDKQADLAVEAASFFSKLVTDFKVDEQEVQKMKDIEHRADDVAHQMMDQLNKTFITPFDREDIHALCKELDNIIDMLYAITNRLKVYKILSPDRNLTEFSRVIEMSVKGVAQAVKGLRDTKNYKAILKVCIEVNSLENLGDKMRDDMLGELFEKYANDPMAVIKWKEIYQDAERVLDVCEDVVHMVESILVKQA